MNDIKNLITKYKNQNREILDRRPELSMYGDFTPDGIRFFCNSSFIEDLQAINYNRCCTELPTKYSIAFAGFVATNIEVQGNEIKIIDSINGFGDKIPNKSVSVLKK